jgi:hypothetical protein
MVGGYGLETVAGDCASASRQGAKCGRSRGFPDWPRPVIFWVIKTRLGQPKIGTSLGYFTRPGYSVLRAILAAIGG